MRILIATPATRGSHSGNRVTAVRWAGHLRRLGHSARVIEAWDGRACDLLVCLHSRKSAPSVERFRRAHPSAPLIVGLAGTDLYEDLPDSAEALRSLECADLLVTLQPKALEALPPWARGKARPIFQSASAPPDASPPPEGVIRAMVIAHLRSVKEPLLGARAALALPPDSHVRLELAGAALEPELAAEARRFEAQTPRFRWVGELHRREVLRRLAGSQLMIITSRLEGGSNALSEAIACGVPVLSTRIAGIRGTLGDDFPGYFPVGDAAALAALLHRFERDPAFRRALRERVQAARPLVAPERERESWRAVLAEVVALARPITSRGRSA